MKFQRREVYYSGQVQGVGFRYTTYRIAQRFDVRGFVRNLPDRRVLLTVEGRESELNRFLAAIAETMGSQILEAETRSPEYRGEFTAFEIRH